MNINRRIRLAIRKPKKPKSPYAMKAVIDTEAIIQEVMNDPDRVKRITEASIDIIRKAVNAEWEKRGFPQRGKRRFVPGLISPEKMAEIIQSEQQLVDLTLARPIELTEEFKQSMQEAWVQKAQADFIERMTSGELAPMPMSYHEYFFKKDLPKADASGLKPDQVYVATVLPGR